MKSITVCAAECDYIGRKCTHNKKCVFYIGADLDEYDNDGNTPLIEASTTGHLDAVEILVAAGKMAHLSWQQLHDTLQVCPPKTGTNFTSTQEVA